MKSFLSVAIIAIARKVIILDWKDLDGFSLVGIAAIVIALTVGYFLMKRSQGQKKEIMLQDDQQGE